MTREEFDTLDVFEQIKYVNDMLGELSLNKICDGIGISRAGLSKRFKQHGYTFYQNSYVLE